IMDNIESYAKPRKHVKSEFTPKKTKSNLQRLPNKNFKLLIVIFGLILLKHFFEKESSSSSLDLNKFIKSSETKEILSAIIPYLDGNEQQNVYTVLGLLEALNTLYGIADGTYQKVQISNAPVLFKSDKERGIGILEVVKPYI